MEYLNTGLRELIKCSRDCFSEGCLKPDCLPNKTASKLITSQAQTMHAGASTIKRDRGFPRGLPGNTSSLPREDMKQVM